MSKPFKLKGHIAILGSLLTICVPLVGVHHAGKCGYGIITCCGDVRREGIGKKRERLIRDWEKNEGRMRMTRRKNTEFSSFLKGFGPNSTGAGQFGRIGQIGTFYKNS